MRSCEVAMKSCSEYVLFAGGVVETLKLSNDKYMLFAG